MGKIVFRKYIYIHTHIFLLTVWFIFFLISFGTTSERKGGCLGKESKYFLIRFTMRASFRQCDKGEYKNLFSSH